MNQSTNKWTNNNNKTHTDWKCTSIFLAGKAPELSLLYRINVENTLPNRKVVVCLDREYERTRTVSLNTFSMLQLKKGT